MELDDNIIIKTNNKSYLLTCQPIKYKNEIYLITTPHGIYINPDKKYYYYSNKTKYYITLYKQAYWCDLAIFKFVDNITLSINETRFLKSNYKIIKQKLWANKFKAIVYNTVYMCHLDINFMNRNMFYKIFLDGNNDYNMNIRKGDSGTLFYSNNTNKLVGILGYGKNNVGYLIPGFFINKLLDEKNSMCSPYLPLQLTMKNEKIFVINNKKLCNYEIKMFDNKNVKNGCVYNAETKSNLPIDVYFQIYGNNFSTIIIDNGAKKYSIKVKSLNDYLKYPFKSGMKGYNKNKNTYNYLWENIDRGNNMKKIMNNLVE